MKAKAVLALLFLSALAGASELQGIYTQSPNVVTGQFMYCFILLDGPAPEGGEVVTLTDNTSAVQTPPEITVPEGSLFQQFACQTTAVSAPAVRSLTATLRSVTKTCYYKLIPPPALDRLDLEPTELVGGESFKARVWLTTEAPATQGFEVMLTTNSSSVSFAQPQFLIEAGSKYGVQTGTTKPVNAVFTRTVTATMNGVKRTANLVLHPGQQLVNLTISKNVLRENGIPYHNSAVLTVEMSGPEPKTGTVPGFYYLPDTAGLQFSNWEGGKTYGTATVSAYGQHPPTVVTIYCRIGSVTKTVQILRL